VILGAAAIGAVAAVVVGIAAVGNPVSWAGDRWDDFKSGEFEHEAQGSRFGQGLGSNRYDFWRVAVDEFKDAPLTGVGTENFAEDYVRDRHSPEEPTHPHSLPLRILSQTGLIGTLLFAGFLVTALVGVARVRTRAANPVGRGIAGVGAVVFVYWFLHSSGDWFWAFPALSAPVFAWLALGMRLDPAPVTASRFENARWALPAGVAGAVVAILAAVSLFLPWASALEVKKATEIWRADPDGAFGRLDRAADLNFLSAQPDLIEGNIAAKLNDPDRARAAFDRALGRDPRNWYATLELAALDALNGDRQASLRGLARVAALNPRERETDVVRQGLESGQPVSLETLDADFLERYCARLGRVPGPSGCQPR
jgi:hypothetical protein